MGDFFYGNVEWALRDVYNQCVTVRHSASLPIWEIFGCRKVFKKRLLSANSTKRNLNEN